MKEFKRISIPMKYSHNIDHLFVPKEKAHLIIACKDRRKNFYSSTNPPKWSDSYMASVSWKKMEKHFGDHFTINTNSKLPAWKSEISSFSDLGLKRETLNALKENGFLKPTKIQLFSIPTISKGFNTIIGGETGGGKTLAYVSPILDKIFTDNNETKDSISPKSLILAPTWELCNQISNVISSLGKYLNIQCHLLNSVNKINVDSDIIVSTPYSMSCALKSGDIKTNKLTSLVMDEADFLLGTNFNDSIIDILSKTSIQSTRPVDEVAVGSQLILCNATLPPLIDKVFGKFVPLETFEKIEVDEIHKLIPTVSHKFIRSNKLQKSTVLITLLKAKGLNSNPSTIIFCNKNETVEIISNLLLENEISHSTVCKSVSIEKRLQNFDKFQKGESSVLLCTDIASRGLDTTKVMVY